MFFNKIFHFVKGYVIIRISGFGIERFLYICAKRNISLFDIGGRTADGVLVCVSISDFRKIRPAAKKAGVNIRIIKKCGLPFYIGRLKKRYVLVFGFLLFTGLMFASSFFVWSVEIQTPCGGIPNELFSAIEKAGIHIGAFKPSLCGEDDIKNIILDNTDDIIWVWPYIKRTKVIIEFRPGIRVRKPVNKAIPCDIVARRDGLIMSLTEKNGKAVVKKGDTVLSGDVLIAGMSDSKTDKSMPMHAIGEIKAYTWHEKSRDYSLIKKISTPTGEKKTFYTLKLFSKCINLFKNEEVGYESYTINESRHEISFGDDNYLGIGIYKKEYLQTQDNEVAANYTEIVNNAVRELEAEIAKELLPGSILIDRKITDVKTNDNTVNVTVTMEFIENIGEEREI